MALELGTRPGRKKRKRKLCRNIRSISPILLMAAILHQFIDSISDCLQGFLHPRWCKISAINTTAGSHAWVALRLLTDFH